MRLLQCFEIDWLKFWTAVEGWKRRKIVGNFGEIG